MERHKKRNDFKLFGTKAPPVEGFGEALLYQFIPNSIHQ
jgi:hypothetical protein